MPVPFRREGAFAVQSVTTIPAKHLCGGSARSRRRRLHPLSRVCARGLASNRQPNHGSTAHGTALLGLRHLAGLCPTNSIPCAGARRLDALEKSQPTLETPCGLGPDADRIFPRPHHPEHRPGLVRSERRGSERAMCFSISVFAGCRRHHRALCRRPSPRQKSWPCQRATKSAGVSSRSPTDGLRTRSWATFTTPERRATASTA